MGSTKFTLTPSGAREMALALEIQLPVNALTQNQPSLARLIQRAADGDTAAFEQIMIHSQQRVMAMTWRMLGNEADARDASQEVFLRVFKYLRRYKQDQDFFAWLYQITVNVCRDIAKKRQHHRHHVGSIDAGEEDKAFEVAAPQENAEQSLIDSQQRELIARAMATLPDKERASIILRDIEGLPTDEVARIMNSSATTVRSQISSARRKIKLYCERYLRGKGQSSEL
ncbi:MAG: polymerase sigma-70 factor, subfamily [Acidobacteriota bacterium]|nr:polymerase sigma-70 factor, subfamily [Acidobacteriota bacterium]